MASSHGRSLPFPAAFLESIDDDEEERTAVPAAVDPQRLPGTRHSLDSQLGCVDHVDGHTLRWEGVTFICN